MCVVACHFDKWLKLPLIPFALVHVFMTITEERKLRIKTNMDNKSDILRVCPIGLGTRENIVVSLCSSSEKRWNYLNLQ